ncbi:subtilisin-like serine protease [Fusarium beomiforme]|uniref:Subtilisin-like serine protease n=1 Tax=Fusarium beomiforme TaxID=44412 RepID=A0A9P5DM35_9HYPO|nr:subtilisin-like serine protease [Fusarium beomiforme]
MANSRNGRGIRRQGNRSPPFSIQLLKHKDNQGAPESLFGDDELTRLLPASYLTESDDLATPGRHVRTCIRTELDLHRLNKISGWLGIAGRLTPPRPLHHQLLLSREIFITEQMDMHLIWTTGRIFVKPMPRFLLEPRFWTEYLCCRQEYDCSNGESHSRGGVQECECRRLWKCALGFLFSYAALIRHESDFFTAKDKHLLPEEVEWPGWISFVKQLNTEHIYPDIDPRFYHGELRLSRLNKIYHLSRAPLHGYMAHWNQYATFFQDNFAWLAGTTVYIAVVLTAMQVGLATDSLKDNDAFQSASYGFTVFSILGPLICAGLIFLTFCFIFIFNWIMTENHLTYLSWSTLVENEADITVADNNGWTPVIEASFKGHVEVVKLLLENEADITIASNIGVTPVIAASLNGHVEVVKLLLENEADITITSNDGWTPIYAASSNGHVEVVKLLLENEADITVADNDGRTPLIAASSNGHVVVIKLLLGVPHIDASKPDDLGRTALFFASRYGQYRAAQVLLTEGRVNPDTTDWMGSTALFAAVANGHLHVARLLIASGAAVEMQAGAGRSLIWWALRAGNPELLQLLVEHAETVGTRISDDHIPNDLVSTPFDHEVPWCDACTLSIQGGCRYSCSVCDGGFCLCMGCYARGIRLCNKGHVLLLQ